MAVTKHVGKATRGDLEAPERVSEAAKRVFEASGGT